MITVCIAVVNEPVLTKKCIDSVQKYTTGEFEISICDNGSTDKTTIDYLNALEKNHEINLVRFPTNTGVAPAWNAEMRNAHPKSDYIAILHNDGEVIQDWREMLTAPMNEEVVFVGTERCGSHVSNRYVPGVIGNERSILAGHVYMIHYPTLVKYDLFMDEQFVPIYFDDGDWQARFTLAGFKLFVVDVRFPHVEFTTTRNPRNPDVVATIVRTNESRIHRKFEGTFVSHLPGWSCLFAPNSRYTWVHLGGKEFGRVDRVIDTVVESAECVAPYRVPNELCAACTKGGCWKKTLPKEELEFVAKHGLPLLQDYPVNKTVKLIGR